MSTTTRRPTVTVLAVAATAAASMGLAACGGGGSTASTAAAANTSSSSAQSTGAKNEPTITLKLAGGEPATSVTGLADTQFASDLKAISGGHMQAKLFLNGALGATKAVGDDVANGTVQLTNDDVLDPYLPSIDVLNAAYVFSSEPNAIKTLNSPAMHKLLWDKLQSSGLRVLNVWPNGFSQLLSNKPVRTVQDFKGLKIRTFVPNVEIPEYQAVGAEGVSVSYEQVFTGLSTGLINAATQPLNLAVPLKWNEPANYITMLNMTYTSLPFIVSQKFWSTLDTTQQGWLTKAAAKALAWEETKNDAMTAAALKQLKTNPKMHVITVDTAPFKKAFQAAYPQINKKYPGVLAKIRQIAKAQG